MNAQPNILLLAVDTLRADHLGCYGYDQPTSPFIDSWAKRSIVFENCFSHAPWTIPSFTSILSGLDPIRSRVVGSPWNVPNYTPIRFDDLKPMMADVFREAGYYTYAVDNLIEMGSHPSWFVRGFQTYTNLTDRLYLRHHHVLAEQITDEVLRFDLSRLDQPWFAFLHYWDPHLPYNYPRSYVDRLHPHRPEPLTGANGKPYFDRRGPAEQVSDAFLELIADYDRSILYLDDDLQRLFKGLEQQGALENTVVVLFGDHGESMVEHDVLFDHQLLYDPSIHVPMIIQDPRSGHIGRVSDLVQHHDLFPTLLELAGIEQRPETTGQVLSPWGKTPPRSFVVSTQDGGAAIRALRTEKWKLICHYDLDGPSNKFPADVRNVELYDLDSDPQELVDLARDRPEVVAELRDKLEDWRRNSLQDGSSDPLLEPTLRIDFNDYPGDPELVEFYKKVRAEVGE